MNVVHLRMPGVAPALLGCGLIVNTSLPHVPIQSSTIGELVTCPYCKALAQLPIPEYTRRLLNRGRHKLTNIRHFPKGPSNEQV